MRICRILTNNALVVLDEKGKEQIVCGKGIGYKKRPGDNVDDKLVETVYVKEGDQSFEQIRRTLEALPEEYLLLAQHIVEAANAQSGYGGIFGRPSLLCHPAFSGRNSNCK